MYFKSIFDQILSDQIFPFNLVKLKQSILETLFHSFPKRTTA